MNDATFTLEHHGAIDTLQLAYASYLGRFHGQTLRNGVFPCCDTGARGRITT